MMNYTDRRNGGNYLPKNQDFAKYTRLRRVLRHGFAAAGIWLASVSFGHAEDTILHDFTGGTNDGYGPAGSLTLSGSQLYGMTFNGGDNVGPGTGTIFRINTDGTGMTVLHAFQGGTSDGQYPVANLTLSGSTLYGMTQQGGTATAGTIFSIQTDGSGFSLLHAFAGGENDGYGPNGSLTLSGGKLYGMTQNGGTNNSGAIFSMNADGTGFSLLHSFNEAEDGSLPQGSLILVGSKLYGMVGQSINDGGSVFSMNLDGSGYTTLHGFAGGPDDGRTPKGSLTLVGSTLYGMTSSGGAMGMGTIFSLGLDGSDFDLLHSFGDVSDGAAPVGSLTFSGSVLYGMTEIGGNGTVFSITPDGSDYQILHSFMGGFSDGANPRGDVTVSGDGTLLYGMTSGGGSVGDGTIFTVVTGVPEPGSWTLLTFASTGLLFLRRRRRS